MAGITNDILSADNVNFTGSDSTVGTVTTDGQLLIGSTATPNIKVGNLTSPNSSITIGYSDPNITVDVSNGDVFPWTDTQGTVTVSSFNGYFITASCTATLPASPSQGDVISFVVDTVDPLVITAAGSQQIRMGVAISVAGGTATNTLQGDAITLVYRSADTTWFSIPGAQGVWNLSI